MSDSKDRLRKSPHAHPSLEECGFVTHLLFVVLGFLYVSCFSFLAVDHHADYDTPTTTISGETKLAATTTTSSSSPASSYYDHFFFPIWKPENVVDDFSSYYTICKAVEKWSIFLPAALVILFWTTPVVYFLLNTSSAQATTFVTNAKSLDWPPEMMMGTDDERPSSSFSRTSRTTPNEAIPKNGTTRTSSQQGDPRSTEEDSNHGQTMMQHEQPQMVHKKDDQDDCLGGSTNANKYHVSYQVPDIQPVDTATINDFFFCQSSLTR